MTSLQFGFDKLNSSFEANVQLQIPLGYIGTNEYIVLDDHPENKEEVENFKLNFGKCPLIFVQARKKLSEAREWLETKGYYKNWKNDYKEDVTKL